MLNNLKSLQTNVQEFLSKKQYAEALNEWLTIQNNIHKLSMELLKEHIEHAHKIAEHHFAEFSKKYGELRQKYFAITEVTIDAKVTFLKKAHEIYFSKQQFDAALENLMQAIWLAEKEERKDLLNGLYSQLDICVISLVTNYSGDVFKSQLDSVLHISKQKSLEEYSHVIETAKPTLEQYEHYQQWQSLKTLYQLIESHRTHEAVNFNNEFIIEKIAKLSDYISGKKTSSIPTPWSEYRKKLHELRKNFEEQLGKNNILENQAQFSKSLKKLLAEILNNIQLLLGTPPCPFSVIVTGSLSREDTSPYSDVDFAILIRDHDKREHLYFQAVVKLFQLNVNAIGEPNGLSIDSGDITYLTGQQKLLLNTPKELAAEFNPSKQGDIIQQPETHSIHRSSFLYASEGGENLLSDYKKFLQFAFTEERRVSWAQQYFSLHEEEFKSRELKPINKLKEDILRPLTLWCTDAVLFYTGISVTSIIDIFKVLRSYISDDFVDALETSYAIIQQQRIKAHFKEKSQFDELFDDKVLLQLQTIQRFLTALAYKTHSYLRLTDNTQTHFCPIKNLLVGLNNTPEAKELLRIVAGYLTTIRINSDKKELLFVEEYQTIESIELRKVFYKQLQENEWMHSNVVKNKILNALSYEPNPDGWYPAFEVEKENWRKALRVLFKPTSNEKELARAKENSEWLIHCEDIFEHNQKPVIKTYLLNDNIRSQLFDGNGKLLKKPDTQSGNHTILYIKDSGHSFAIKIFPEQPGSEYAVNQLARRIGDHHGTLLTQVMKFQRGTQPGFVVQVMPKLSGENLEKKLTYDNSFYKKIDDDSFAETLLRTLLTNPEDDKGDDYFLEKINDEKYRLIRIDNERVFYSPEETKGILKSTQSLQVKSLLYCLPQMNEPLSPSVLKRFLRLDVKTLLHTWLIDLLQEQEFYAKLFDDNDVKNHFENKIPSLSLLGIPMGEGLIQELYNRLDSMRKVIQFKFETDIFVTGMELLAVVQPALFKYYDDAFQLTSEPTKSIDRFTYLTKGLYVNGASSIKGVAAISKSLRLKTTLNLENAQKLVRGEENSSNQALMILMRLEEQTLEVVKKALLNGDIKPFQQLIVRQQIFLFEEIQKENLNDEQAEYILNSIAEQKNYLLTAIAGIPFHELSFGSWGSALNDKTLVPILTGAGAHLMKLELRNCSLVTDTTLSQLDNLCPNLRFLRLLNINKSGKKLFSAMQFMQLSGKFSQLTYLEISSCGELIKINLQAVGLKEIHIHKLSRLIEIKTNSLRLNVIHLTECEKLAEVGIKDLYELMGSSPDVKLEKTAISQKDFREKYQYLLKLQCNKLDKNFLIRLEELIQKNLKEHKIFLMKHLDSYSGAKFLRVALQYQKKPSELSVKLLRLLKDESFSIRNAAVGALVQLKESTREVVNFLMDQLESIRDEFIGEWARLRNDLPEVIDALMQFLDHKNRHLRIFSARALIQLGIESPQVIDVLLQALALGDWTAQANAARALGQLKKATLPVIVALAETLASHAHFQLHIDVVDALGRLKLEQATNKVIDSLMKALDFRQEDSQRAVRLVAARVLVQLGVELPKVIDELLEALGFWDWTVTKAAAIALGKLKKPTPKVINALVKLLRETSGKYVRPTIAAVLGQLGKATPEIIYALLKALEDIKAMENTDGNIHESVRGALLQLGKQSPQVIDVLLKALRDSSSIVRVGAAETLVQLGKKSPQVVDVLLKSLDDSNWAVRVIAAETLLIHLEKHLLETIAILVKALTNNDVHVRAAAVKALVQLKQVPPEVIDALMKTLVDWDSKVRVAANAALIQLGKESKAVIDALVKALGHEFLLVRAAAAGVLVRLGIESPQVIDVLLKALTHWDLNVQEAALKTLGLLKEPTDKVIDALMKIMENSDEYVQKYAIEALGKLFSDESLSNSISTIFKQATFTVSEDKNNSLTFFRNTTKKELLLIEEKKPQELNDHNKNSRSNTPTFFQPLLESNQKVTQQEIKNDIDEPENISEGKIEIEKTSYKEKKFL